ncbi:MAG: thiamine pyrophosphate-dependent dehydrogenase E1 component subunit alpha [Candidatus Brocadiia bacterium]
MPKAATKPDTSPDTLLDLYYCMLLSRAFEERLAILYRQGKVLGGIFSGIGQEATAIGTSFDLREGDAVFPLHRDIGAALTRGIAPKTLMAQILGKSGGLSGGKVDYLHSGDPALGVYGSTSMIGSSIPVAAGAALAFKLKRTNCVAVAYIGEGGTSTGDFHEALNFAGVQRLPLIIVVENNFFAYSTPVAKQMAVENAAERAAGYGMPGHTCSGNDLISVRQLACQAVQRARDWLGPTLIECKTYRWHGHSEHDDASYRESEEFLEWKSRDPIPRYELYLREREVLTDEIAERHRADATREVDEAVAFAEKSPYPEPHEALDHLFTEGEP